jgi:hypothetical protein
MNEQDVLDHLDKTLTLIPLISRPHLRGSDSSHLFSWVGLGARGYLIRNPSERR